MSTPVPSIEAGAVEVGAVAPPLLLGDTPEATALAELGREPLVLAFLSDDEDTGGVEGFPAGDVDAVRAELRGLGATLVALSETCLWCFRPDDEVQVFARAPVIDGKSLRDAAARFGVRAGGDGRVARPAGAGLRGLFVLDERRVIRFGRALDEAVAPTLSDALGAAGRAMLASPPGASRAGMSRRELLIGGLVAGFALALADGCAGARPAPATSGAATTAPPPPLDDRGEVEVRLNVNGNVRALRVEPRVSLLDALREGLRLTGTKKGCDHGQCGACTVWVDGRRINSCLTLAVMAEGARITTIEGVGTLERLHPMQAAFVAEDALQCGYCTPGQIMSAIALIAEGHARDDDDVREQMSGNLCRCGAYPHIVAAIRRVRQAT